MKKKVNPIFRVFGIWAIVIGFIFTVTSCSDYMLDSGQQSSEPPLQGIVDFLMYANDNGGGIYNPNNLTHTVEIHKPIWFRARTSNLLIQYFTWNMGNGDTTSGREFIYSYHLPGMYTICVTGWTQDSHYVFCDQLEVVISTSNANPVLQLQNATSVSGGRYKLTLLFRKKSVTDYTNCGTLAPFATYNTGPDSTSWITHSNLRDSTPGHFRDTITVPNYYLLKMAFGGSPGCYANMAPTVSPPQTSQYWHDDPVPARRGLWARVVNGTLVKYDTVIHLPGSVGDGVEHPIVRLGVSSTNQDSIVFYFNTAFITSTTGTYQWSNNVTGITVGQALADVYGYPGWKMGRLHRNQIMALVGQLVKFKYGRPISNPAAFQGSILYNPENGLLEIIVIDLGDNGTQRLALRLLNKITGEILGDLEI